MAIRCAKCDRRFPDIEAARAHVGHCPGGEPAFYIPLPKKQNQSKTNRQDNESHSYSEPIPSDKFEDKCPRTKTEVFPCPRCGYCKSETERREFFKATTWYHCKYPEIVNWRMLTVEDILRMPTGGDK